MLTDPDKLKQIIELDTDLNRIQDADILMEKILSAARSCVNADAGSIYIKEGGRLAIKFAQNDTKQNELPPGRKLIYNIFKTDIDDKTISGYAVKTGKTINIPDVYQIPPSQPYSYDPEYDKIARYHTQSILTIPLQTNMGEILGVLQIINAKDPTGAIVPFTDSDELVIGHFAVNATLALQRANLIRTVLLRMMSMAEMRDPHETGAHVNRVAGYAVEIYEEWARRKGIEEAEIDRIRDTLRMAAMLHDVGKVAIPDQILKKPGRFTPEEFAVMTTHSYLGARLFLDKQSKFDEMAAEVALMHHENWDGSGYPGKIDLTSGQPIFTDNSGKALGRVGEEISIYGRIVAIADVYDALRSRRVYKEAWGESDVATEIKKMSGTKFDPQLVDIFFDILPSINQTTKRYEEAT